MARAWFALVVPFVITAAACLHHPRAEPPTDPASYTRIILPAGARNDARFCVEVQSIDIGLNVPSEDQAKPLLHCQVTVGDVRNWVLRMRAADEAEKPH